MDKQESARYWQLAEDDRAYRPTDELYGPNAPVVFTYPNDEFHRAVEAKIATLEIPTTEDDLPVCVECGEVAFEDDPEDWHWTGDGWYCQDCQLPPTRRGGGYNKETK